MKDQAFLRRKERYVRNFVRLTNKTLANLEEIRNEIGGIELIYQKLSNLFVENKLITDKPIIGTFCYMIPDEIIIAAGGFPIKLCGGNYIAQIAGDEIAPRDSCPVVKSALGSFEMELLSIYTDCKLAIVPMSCDCKKKMAEKLVKYTKVLPLHIPSVKNEQNFKQLIPLYKDAIKHIENETGKKITESSLRKAINLTKSINREARKLMDFKKKLDTVITGSQAMAIVNAYQYIDREEYLSILKTINKSLKVKVKKKETMKRNKPRILLTGSPIVFPNYKLPYSIEELGAIIVADETCAGDRMLNDPVLVIDKTYEGMVRALVVKSILPCTCPTFSSNKERIYRLKQMIKDYQVDGILYNVLRGCIPYDFEQKAVEQLSKELEIPIISIETDYNTEDTEQIKIRLEAFVEMIKMK